MRLSLPDQPESVAQARRAAILLVVPVGAIHRQTGGGQRTGIIFEALKRIGDVVVFILSDTPIDGAEVFFPGARRVMYQTHRAITAPASNPVLRTAQAVDRFLRPRRTFTPHAGLRDALLAAFDQWGGPGDLDRPRLVAVRYARTFAATGLAARPEARLFVCLDIDDRDDTKIDLQIRRRLGDRLGTLARGLWQRRFEQTLRTILSRASILFIAKTEDRFDIAAPPQVVLGNVPFEAPAVPEIVPADRTDAVLLFVGSVGNRPNLAGVTWFLRRCWPAIRAARPDAEVRVVGLGDWSALPAALSSQPGVTIVGTVDDVAAEYARARAAICPIQEGAGSQIKVIEACAFGRPVVTTAFAAGGFGADIAAALPVARDAAGFAEACIALLADPARAARQGSILRALQQERYSRVAMERLIVTTLSAHIGLAQPRPEVPA
jgi:glycosyltransferase involved in cell wall biosynthesis